MEKMGRNVVDAGMCMGIVGRKGNGREMKRLKWRKEEKMGRRFSGCWDERNRMMIYNEDAGEKG